MDDATLPVDSAEFYRTLVENAAEGMLTIDEDSRIVYANPAVEEILGYPAEELVGSSKMKIIPERLRDTHAEALATYVRTGERNVDWNGVELPALHKEGHEVPTLISLREHVHDGDRYFTGIIRDITDRRRREAELRDQKARLDEFADILAHDIRNPLSVAEGYTRIAGAEHDLPELDRVQESLERIDTLVEDVLELSKEGQLIGETESVGLEGCVRDAWRNVETASASLHVEGDLGTVEADASRLRELFENLFRNCVEHGSADNREAVDSAEHDGPGVTVRVGRRGDTVYVADDGPGVPASLRETIFDHGYSTNSNGTGFGLAIVRQIADGHGWTLSVTDSAEGGAQFELRGVPAR